MLLLCFKYGNLISPHSFCWIPLAKQTKDYETEQEPIYYLVVGIAIYGPMINKAPYVMLLMRAITLRGQVRGDWALEIDFFSALWNGIEP